MLNYWIVGEYKCFTKKRIFFSGIVITIMTSSVFQGIIFHHLLIGKLQWLLLIFQKTQKPGCTLEPENYFLMVIGVLQAQSDIKFKHVEVSSPCAVFIKLDQVFSTHFTNLGQTMQCDSIFCVCILSTHSFKYSNDAFIMHIMTML